MTAQTHDDELLSAQDAMRLLGVSRAFLTKHRYALRGVKIGGLLKFRRAHLLAYIERRTLGEPITRKTAPAATTVPTTRLRAIPSGINEVTRRPFRESVR